MFELFNFGTEVLKVAQLPLSLDLLLELALVAEGSQVVAYLQHLFVELGLVVLELLHFLAQCSRALPLFLEKPTQLLLLLACHLQLLL